MNGNVKNVVKTLTYTYGIVPIVAGLDKFMNLLSDWTQYLDGSVLSLIPFSSQTFMMIVGVIEIAAGILVLTKTKIGAYVVMGWLVSIAIVLLINGRFLDVAVRDLVMAVGVFSLARLKE